jgi:hypothetical protein
MAHVFLLDVIILTEPMKEQIYESYINKTD